jgi:spermidine synthase
MNIFDGIQIPKVIFETQSKYNGIIQVFQVGSTRKIKVNQVDQSVNHKSESGKRLVWGRVIEVLKDEEPNLKNILILGLGGGTVAHLVAENFTGSEIVSVEIDQAMVDIARNYFDIDKIPNHRVIVDDAMRVVVEPETFNLNPGSFQAVYVDIFIGEKYPDLGSSGNFIAAVKKMATSGGLVIFNRIYITEHQDDVNIFIDSLSNFLKGIKCLIVAGHTNSDNILIYGRA